MGRFYQLFFLGFIVYILLTSTEARHRHKRLDSNKTSHIHGHSTTEPSRIFPVSSDSASQKPGMGHTEKTRNQALSDRPPPNHFHHFPQTKSNVSYVDTEIPVGKKTGQVSYTHSENTGGRNSPKSKVRGGVSGEVPESSRNFSGIFEKSRAEGGASTPRSVSVSERRNVAEDYFGPAKERRNGHSPDASDVKTPVDNEMDAAEQDNSTHPENAGREQSPASKILEYFRNLPGKVFGKSEGDNETSTPTPGAEEHHGDQKRSDDAEENYGSVKRRRSGHRRGVKGKSTSTSSLALHQEMQILRQALAETDGLLDSSLGSKKAQLDDPQWSRTKGSNPERSVDKVHKSRCHHHACKPKTHVSSVKAERLHLDASQAKRHLPAVQIEKNMAKPTVPAETSSVKTNLAQHQQSKRNLDASQDPDQISFSDAGTEENLDSLATEVENFSIEPFATDAETEEAQKRVDRSDSIKSSSANIVIHKILPATSAMPADRVSARDMAKRGALILPPSAAQGSSPMEKSLKQSQMQLEDEDITTVGAFFSDASHKHKGFHPTLPDVPLPGLGPSLQDNRNGPEGFSSKDSKLPAVVLVDSKHAMSQTKMIEADKKLAPNVFPLVGLDYATKGSLPEEMFSTQKDKNPIEPLSKDAGQFQAAQPEDNNYIMMLKNPSNGYVKVILDGYAYKYGAPNSNEFPHPKHGLPLSSTGENYGQPDAGAEDFRDRLPKLFRLTEIKPSITVSDQPSEIVAENESTIGATSTPILAIAEQPKTESDVLTSTENTNLVQKPPALDKGPIAVDEEPESQDESEIEAEYILDRLLKHFQPIHDILHKQNRKLPPGNSSNSVPKSVSQSSGKKKMTFFDTKEMETSKATRSPASLKSGDKPDLKIIKNIKKVEHFDRKGGMFAMEQRETELFEQARPESDRPPGANDPNSNNKDGQKSEQRPEDRILERPDAQEHDASAVGVEKSMEAIKLQTSTANPLFGKPDQDSPNYFNAKGVQVDNQVPESKVEEESLEEKKRQAVDVSSAREAP